MHSNRSKTVRRLFFRSSFFSPHTVQCVILIVSLNTKVLYRGIAMSFSLFPILLITLIDGFEISYLNTARQTMKKRAKDIWTWAIPNETQCIIYLLSRAIVHCLQQWWKNWTNETSNKVPTQNDRWHRRRDCNKITWHYHSDLLITYIRKIVESTQRYKSKENVFFFCGNI